MSANNYVRLSDFKAAKAATLNQPGPRRIEPGAFWPLPARGQLDWQLNELTTNLLELSNWAEKAISQAFHALKNLNHFEAERLIEEELICKQLRQQLDQQVLVVLSLPQPLPQRDLCYTLAAIQIGADLEQISAATQKLAVIAEQLECSPPLAVLGLLEKMAWQTRQMLHIVIGAFLSSDLPAATRVAAQDAIVEGLYKRIETNLLELLAANPALQDRLTPLLEAAHNLERIGDSICNICSKIAYVTNGPCQESTLLAAEEAGDP